MERYVLNEQEGAKDRLLLTDAETGLTVSFERGRYNETHRATLPAGWPTTPEGVQKLAGDMAAMADWLRANHYADAMPMPVDFVAPVKKAMRQRGLTASALAGEVGVSAGALSNFLNRRHGLEQSKLERLFTLLGLRIG